MSAVHIDMPRRNPGEVERLASELTELSTRYNFAFWLAGAKMLRGWAQSVSGDSTEGISWIEQGIKDYRAAGALVGLSVWLALKAEALYLMDRTCEALEAIAEAQGLVEKCEVRWWSAELQRLRGVFLIAMGAQETEIEASFHGAISTAKQQKATSLLTRVKG
jgi:predicted ATPase